MNYPGGLNKKFNKKINFGNRGMKLEDAINNSNLYYLNHDIAVIHKKPTPVKVLKLEYLNNKEIIKEAFFEKPSTTDYNGIYKGYYIDFEAKETANKNYFPLNNIHKHQIKHLEDIIKMGGIGFLIIYFSSLDLTYYLDGSKLLEFMKESDRKSIPLEYIKDNGYIIRNTYNPEIDYLKIIDQIYFKGDNK